jgi:hypothetical protein
MAPVLHRSLGPDAPFPDVRVHHVRYAPGRKLAVRYDVGLEGRQYDAVAMIAAREYLVRRAAKPEHVALARLVGRRSPAAMPLHYDVELEALVQWYPLDLELPALAEPPARLVAELEAAGVKRISLASSLYKAAMTGMVEAAREAKEKGTFGYIDRAISTPDLNALMKA